ncbi:MAG: class I tRNA ligase family protein, partial [Thermaurantiacus tibetensis]
LYCDPPASLRRRAWRTTVATLFDWLVTWLAPVLVFTAEEAWGHRHGPEAGSVHHRTYALVDPAWRDPALEAAMERVLALRAAAFDALEALRRDKAIGSFLQAELDVAAADPADRAAFASLDLAELLLVADVRVTEGEGERFAVSASRTHHARCDRCWRHLPDVDPQSGLCTRCAEAVA